jgi:hypothetical protein
MLWDGTGWTIMTPADNPLQYMEALKDITDGAPDGIFSNVFCQVLFAQQAAIDTLQSTLIRILKAIYGGDRFNEDGSVKDDSKAGFWLGADGRLKAANAEISGTVNATSGVFGLVDSTGFLSSKYLGSAIDRTGGEIFEYFEFVPIGKKLNINGGGELLNNTQDGGTNQFHNCIVLWIERKTVDMIEIRGYPINYLDRWVLCQCSRNSNTVVSHRYLFSW